MNNSIEKTPNYNDIFETYNRIKSFIHKTPVLSSKSINKITGAEIYFKCENFQKTGAFKFRGATNAVLQLTENQKKNGVATHSSGNHAAALALAAKIAGVKAYVVMPENAPLIKKKAVKYYGAEITFCEPTIEARESTLEKITEKTGAEFIHPYNNFNVICGQATSAFELLNDYKILDIISAPVGGGGLLSGTAISAKSLRSDIQVIAAEPKNADDAFKSFNAGYIIPSNNPKTIADGLLTSLGSLTFKIISENVDNILTVSEDSIIEAMRLIWERMKIIVEPSSAVPLAAILENKNIFKNKRVGIIISGGNVDLNNLPF
ncbi:MAG: pyridoxal-phosphate dependent enzyme [Bacteroidales bacterium]|nr:pyridoxal-phosphate dependent enzyme [Bacteroidales bacterium]MBN2756537.1 pyridoxal-phosphate dependent enzyme [Bacteroidales bacterium]